MRRLFLHRSSAATVISLIALFFAVGGTTVAATEASAAVAAAAGWSIQATPNPVGGSNSILNGGSCTSASACTAVGDYNSGTTGVTLAERWNGSTWSIQTTPNPAGASDIFLQGVSCTSASACTAVGDYFNGTTRVTLAERWNGSTWSIQTTPNPAGASSYSILQGVSCTSATACTAFGEDGNGTTDVTLAERWNGTRWSIQHTPNPAGGSEIHLLRVSCTSTTACTAVGFYSNATTTVTLAERWNGSRWSIQHTPNPAGGSNSTLNGVSCASATACTAVGGSFNGTTGVTLAERWNG